MRDTTLFVCDGKAYTVEHAVMIARSRPAGEALWLQGVMTALACAMHAEDEGFVADNAVVQGDSEDFRMERCLVTAEDTEAWLSERGLTTGDFGEHFLRRFWFERLVREHERILAEIRPPEEMLLDALWAEVFLGDGFRDFAYPLASRVAAMAEEGSNRCEGIEPCEHAREMEACCERVREAVLRPDLLARELGTRQKDLTRLDFSSLRFKARDAAAEAYLCLKEEGESVECLAGVAGAKAVRRSLFLEDVPEALQSALFSAIPGEVFAPIEEDEGFLVIVLHDKQQPGIGDPAVRERLDEMLLDRHFAALIDRHITWKIPRE